MSEVLTDQQQRFVDEYLVCWNGAEAARRAGYSVDTARFQASRLLTNVNIRAAIDARLAEAAMSAGEVLARVTEIARGSMADFLAVNGRGVRLDLKQAAAADKLHLVKKYSKTKQSESIELYDAQSALELLGKYHKLWTDKFEHSGEVGRPARIVKIYRTPKPVETTAESDGP